jgi:DNA-directed RNA polymerase specialized sigma24 family protein
MMITSAAHDGRDPYERGVTASRVPSRRVLKRLLSIWCGRYRRTEGILQEAVTRLVRLFGFRRNEYTWWWQRPPDQWVAACRDMARRRRKVVVTVTDDGLIALAVPPGEVALLEPLQVGQLRAQLRAAIFDLDQHYVGQRPARTCTTW